MTSYEIARLLAEPVLPVFDGKVRRALALMINQTPRHKPSVLDVGGRKSPYSVGLPCEITVLDIPRESEIQKRLHLGLTDKILREIKRRRSNVTQVVLGDMTECTLPSESFDGVVCVEVIEHVPQDHLLVEQIARVLKPGGWLYLTTPNGDYVRNEPPDYNPDHIRLYTRQQLSDLLSSHFGRVSVSYGIKTGKYRYRGQQGLDPRHPLLMLQNMACNFVNRIESRGLENEHRRTAHLFA